MENVNEQIKSIKNKISNFFEESPVPPPTISETVSSRLTLKSVASMAVVAIPVIAGVCYLKDRKKVNADTSSAFMNMGNGNF